jgi:hypothetical protein
LERKKSQTQINFLPLAGEEEARRTHSTATVEAEEPNTTAYKSLTIFIN